MEAERMRLRQMEANKRKLDELLPNLAAGFCKAGAKPMPKEKVTVKPRRKRRPPPDAPIRQSGRIAKLEEQRPAKAQRNEPKPVPPYATDKQRDYAKDKAKKLQDQLDSDHPTFIRPISHSAAHKATTLIFPVNFKKYLPTDRDMVLVGEVSKEFDVLYGINKQHGNHITRWRPFAADHKLADGDCCVFQLIEETKFKVHIIRASSYDKNDH